MAGWPVFRSRVKKHHDKKHNIKVAVALSQIKMSFFTNTKLTYTYLRPHVPFYKAYYAKTYACEQLSSTYSFNKHFRINAFLFQMK